jgi:hypothetical protein
MFIISIKHQLKTNSCKLRVILFTWKSLFIAKTKIMNDSFKFDEESMKKRLECVQYYLEWKKKINARKAMR